MKKSQFGVIGLAVMGQNLARNVASRGYQTSVYNRSTDKTDKLIAEHGDEGLVGFPTLEEFVNSLESPRRIMIMVKAGGPVDAVIGQLTPLLDKGDIIIDGGNSFYPDTIRREQECKENGLFFFGCGVSGGEEGALKGPSLMPGGAPEVWEALKPILESIAAKDFQGKPCVTHVGADGAGHFVKMVHNGIEYGIMQMMAEAYQLLKEGYDMDNETMADIFEEYQNGRLESFLFEIAIPILRKKDDKTDEYLLDKILDKAGQKGTGRWTAMEGFKHGTELSVVGQAVNARVSSSQKTERTEYAKLFTKPATTLTVDKSDIIKKLENAFYAAILISYAQGFDVIKAAAEEQNWKINLSEVARIWQGGCIIRAKVLETLTAAFLSDPDKELLQIESIRKATQEAWADLRAINALGINLGIPIYCFGSALTSFESLTSERTSANFIQGLRDFFGAHTYQRVDKDGIFHTQWDE